MIFVYLFCCAVYTLSNLDGKFEMLVCVDFGRICTCVDWFTVVPFS